MLDPCPNLILTQEKKSAPISLYAVSTECSWRVCPPMIGSQDGFHADFLSCHVYGRTDFGGSPQARTRLVVWKIGCSKYWDPRLDRDRAAPDPGRAGRHQISPFRAWWAAGAYLRLGPTGPQERFFGAILAIFKNRGQPRVGAPAIVARVPGRPAERGIREGPGRPGCPPPGWWGRAG